MGLITELILLPLAPIRGVLWVGEQLRQEAYRQWASPAAVQARLDAFADVFNDAYLAGLRQKMGLMKPREDDLALAQSLLGLMAADRVDFTLLFRRLADAAADPDALAAARDLFVNRPEADEWLGRWRHRLDQEETPAAERAAAMRGANPAFIPRNHRVEHMIEAAVERGDFQPFEELLRVLSSPYEDQPEHAAYAEPPPATDRRYVTYCGT